MRKKHARNASAPTRETSRVVEARAPTGSLPVPYNQPKSLGGSNGCASCYLTSLTPFRDPACLVTIRSVKTGESSRWLECLRLHKPIKLVARHGACLYFTRDGSPTRYSEVVAAQSCNNGQDTRLFAFCEGHRNRIAINEQRLTQAPSGQYPEQLCNTTEKQR